MKYYGVRHLADMFSLTEGDIRTLARLGILQGGRIGPSWVFSNDAVDALEALLDTVDDDDDEELGLDEDDEDEEDD